MIRTNDYEHHTPDYSQQSDEDKALLKMSLESDDWSKIGEYEEQAQSNEIKEAIHAHKMRLYHREEMFAGIL